MGRDLGIPHKQLEKCRGFSVYVSRTYSSMVPYLKGIHQTLDGWWGGRESDGWKLTLSELKSAKDKDEEITYLSSKDALSHVYPCTRLEDDVKCLAHLFANPHPIVRHVRTRFISMVTYGFGDASGSGFGSTIAVKSGLRVRHGVWGKDDTSNSSNYKELTNLVETIELEVQSGLLQGTELSFLLTTW